MTQIIKQKLDLPSTKATREYRMADHESRPPPSPGAEILWATLVGEGVTTVFGYPGGAIPPSTKLSASFYAEQPYLAAN